ncbi:MAG TPA: hypothetical protein VKA60_23465 [Blastocatellia bacterium]|nr:hypothetical protein [Blastocatellia bacterium]
MRKLACVVFIILALPVFGALTIHSSRQAQAFNVVAVAGHTQVGGDPCDCGPGCLPDYPGENIPPICGIAQSVTRDVDNSGSNGDGGALLLAVFVFGLAIKFILKL